MCVCVCVCVCVCCFCSSSALHGGGQCSLLDRRDVPSVMIDCEEDKENVPSESDYEDLPSMYKDEDDDEDDDEDEDDDIFTSTFCPRRHFL